MTAITTQVTTNEATSPTTQVTTDEATPSEATLFRAGKATKHLWNCKSQLELLNGVLYYNWKYPTHTVRKLVVRKDLHEEVLKLCHDLPAGGHYGQDKTLEKVRCSFIWVGLRSSVEVY